MGQASTASLREQVTAYFASEPHAIIDPWPLYRELRETAPVFDLGSMVVVTRYDDIKTVARDDVRLSIAYREQGIRAEAARAALPERLKPTWDAITAFQGLYMSHSDGERHDRLKSIAQRFFAPRKIAELERSAQELFDRLLTDMSRESDADLRMLYRFPLIVICDLLEIPEADREQVHRWANKIALNRGGTEGAAHEKVLSDAYQAVSEFRGYVEQVLERHRKSKDRTELVNALLEAEDSGQVTDVELAATFVNLLFAGHETSAKLIGMGTMELLRHPAQWQALVEDPTRATAATEELLRYVAPIHYTGRVAIQDLDIAGVPVAEGKMVVPLWASANRDAAVFVDPDKLDIGRRDAIKHLAFGMGGHSCLGNVLARLEGRIAFRTLATRFPKLELACDPSTLEWEGHSSLRTPKSIPVRMGPDHGSNR